MPPSVEPIAPFPESIDRVSFGHWLSGFTDGEGHFSVTLHKTKVSNTVSPRTCFVITLRSDDAEALRLIQSYWRCGTVNNLNNYSKSNGKPQTRYEVNSINDLKYMIVPHFVKYPLYAKKAREFLIWKEAVELQHSWFFRQRPHGTNGHFRGQKWTAEELARFEVLSKLTREQRAYKG